MALPALNETPRYELVVPSTKKKVRFRPYLVKEEKILLIANESSDQESVINAITDTVMACVHGEVKREDLTMFDLEYMFIKIRSKSVGENIQLYYLCKDCDHQNTVDVNLDDVVCKVPRKKNTIKLSDEVALEMAYPSYSGFDLDNEDETEAGFSLIASSIKSVLTEEERIDVSEESKEEVHKFIESMTTDQFQKVADFVREMPVVRYESSFVCQNCGEKNEFEVRGMKSFF